MKALQPRTKKLIGILVFLPGMLLYVGLVVTLSDFLPAHWFVYLVYYIIMGIVWALPLKPAMAWMNRPVDDEDY